MRFGAELVFTICEAKEVEVVIINKGEDASFEDDLAKDVLEIITVFSARLYGSRSRNREKAKRKLARLHARIANIRNDAIHKLTTSLANRFGTVVVEDLNTKGMTASAAGTKENPGKNVKAKSGLNRSILDQGFHEFRRQLTYKMEERGGVLLVADRWFASSKICSSCGHKCDELPLSVREWDCPTCGTHHDRDVNAAKNLANLAVSSTVIACGEGW